MRITRNREKIYYDFLPTIAPRVSVSSGDRMTVETFDAAGGMFMEGWKYVRPNPVTGPIYVNGATPGDTLEVEIHNI
ncbi:MAG: acetamidase/formamidase family protein, partial [Oscillospiraceae bacterium]|nr:acetamidase/formamidase family protein [Oscillospiraceae bacterium]